VIINNVSAIQISLIVGLCATLCAIVPAVYLAWILARKEFPGRNLINILIFFPMVSPPVVTGFLLLKLLGRNSFLGMILENLGITIPFSILGAIIASAVVGFPLLIMFIRSTFAGIDPQLENYALTAGYTPFKTFMKVTLPLSYPGILAGAIVCFARSLGEFGATIVLAGNMEGETRTIPMAIYSLLDSPAGEIQANQLLVASVVISCISLFAYEFFTRSFWKRMEWK
jgi:molybdate transport system permease protein